MNRIKEKGLIGILASGAIMYLLLGMLFVQSAKAEEEDVFDVAHAREYLLDSDMEWGVYYAVTSSLIAVINAEAIGYSVTVGDFEVYASVYDILYTCAMTGTSGKDATFGVLAASSSSTIHIGAAAYMYFADRCSDELRQLHAPSEKNKGRTS